MNLVSYGFHFPPSKSSTLNHSVTAPPSRRLCWLLPPFYFTVLIFYQACWAQHKRQYPDELIHKEIEEFNKQCSVWWYNLSEQERDRFQEMADR